jgi:hypothetical protein
MLAVSDSRRTLRRASHSRAVGIAGRIGLAAQGLCFGIIGALAIELAAGSGGRATDPQGALAYLARGGWTRVLLFLLVVGFACYSLWRLAQALLDRGDMGDDLGGLGRRAIQLVQGTSYAFLTYGAAKTLAGHPARPGGEKRAADGILGWPAGREIVAVIALGLAITAVVIAYWALSRRFLESLDLTGLGRRPRQVVELLGVVGLCALAVVTAVVAWFLAKAAYEFHPGKAVGIGGALARIDHASYGPALLGVVAAGLIVFAIFDLVQARYHEA